MPRHRAEGSHRSIPLESGIGRAANPEFVSNFSELFEQYTHPSVKLETRKVPGIIYMSHEELARKLNREYAGESTEREAEAYTEYMVSLLGLKGALDKTWREAATLSVKPFGKMRTSRNGNSFALTLNALDNPSDFYDTGFMCIGEKTAIRTEEGLSVPSMQPTSGRPTLRIHLGIMRDPAGQFRGFAELEKHLPVTVDLLPVGTVRL